MGKSPDAAVPQPAEAADVIHVRSVLEQQRIGGFQILLAVLCIICLVVDGFDAQAMGFAAPAIIRAWHVPRGAFGPVFGASNFGLMIGAIVFGFLGDRFGRKKTVVLSACLLGVCSLITAGATNVSQLLLYRFLCGLGVGGVMPNTIVLGTEYSPKRLHGRAIWLMYLGYQSGAASGALVSTQLFPHFGWKSMFYVGGIAPLLIAFLGIVFLPESVRFLSLRPQHRDKLAAILSKVDRRLVIRPETRLIVQEETRFKASVKHLFTQGRAVVTLLVWFSFLMTLMTMMFLLNWLPTVLENPAISRSMAALATSMLQVGGILGGLLISYLFDMYGARVTAICFLIGAPLVALIGISGQSAAYAVAAVFLVGCAFIGGNTTTNAIAARIYPTFIRSNGVGWYNSVGRVGSILGPVIGGLLISMNVSMPKLFMFAAIPCLCTAIAMFVLSYLHPGPIGEMSGE